jgi:hypothetical protein
MKSLKLISTFFLLLTLSPLAQAQSAMELFTKDVEPLINSFKKEIQLYHYFYAPTVKDESGKTVIHSSLNAYDSRQSWVRYLINERTKAFWDLTNHSTAYINAGPGMYFALDPNSSKEFGESAVLMRVPEGLRYLNIFTVSKLKTATLKALVNEGIVERNQLAPSATTLGLNSGFGGPALKNMVRPENLEFRKFISKYIHEQNIQFIEYHYQSHLAGFCKTASQSAFVYIGTKPAQIHEADMSKDEQLFDFLERPFYPAMLYSDYAVEERLPEESRKLDLVSRFKNILTQIRLKGTGQAAKKLIQENLSENEINELESESYECTRRY